jgi:class 3 adenylate cyclase
MSERSVRGCHADRIFTITKEKKPKPRSAGLATAWGIGGVRKTLCARRQFLIGYFSVSMPPEEGAWLEAAGGRCYSIKGSSSLGRSAANTIVLESPKVSRRHALVHLQNIGEPWLIDFGSSNGTFLNQRRIHRPIRLSDGDEITIGDQILKFHQPVGISEEYKTDVVQRTLRNIDKIPCWLLVADIRGFTPLSQQMRSEDLDLFLGAWIFSCKEIIENQHGIINKYLGDGFLAYWPEASTRPEEIVAVISGLKELQRNESPPFRLVAHFGPVATGGVASMGEESLMGGEVNLIFRLEKLAGSLGEPCCVSETANAKLHGLVATRSLGQFELKGFEGKCAFFAL